MFKTRFISMLVLLAAVVTGAWADGIVCTASDLGKVLCTDGSIYENVSAATTAGKTAAAVIAYVDETNKNGLAIALADEGSLNWSTAKTTCEGKTAIAGAKWCLPSQDQWKQMFKANGGNEGSCAGLNATITTAGGYALQVEFAVYWSSSEYNPGKYAYDVMLDEGAADWDYGSEDSGNSHLVRACLAFDIAAPAASTYTVTLKEGTEDATSWTIAPAEATTTGVAAGTEVKATYGGVKKVKSVKAKKKAPASLIVNPVVGQIIGSDGKNYDANATLPDGVTKVAMIAYLGNGSDCTNGLAIQLNASPESKNWNDAKTYASGLTPVPGGTWRLPSKADWQNMFVGCAKSGDAGASDYMDPIAGFKEKIGATGIAWVTSYYWSSTDSGSKAWSVNVDLGNYPHADFDEDGTSYPYYVLGCLAF